MLGELCVGVPAVRYISEMSRSVFCLPYPHPCLSLNMDQLQSGKWILNSVFRMLLEDHTVMHMASKVPLPFCLLYLV